ncbi:MAG: hypothetical protein V4548_05020 [Bacteroidota bacterium]
MMKLKFFFVILFLVPNFIFSQEATEFTKVKTSTGVVKIPGTWTQLNTADESDQTYLKNNDGVVIAIAQNPKKAYPFFKPNKSAFENVKEFYKWDSDYRKQNKFKTEKLKESLKREYIIWKYNDGKMDNIFLFGSTGSDFSNLLIYTNIWTQEKQIEFLENVYQLNNTY